MNNGISAFLVIAKCQYGQLGWLSGVESIGCCMNVEVLTPQGCV